MTDQNGYELSWDGPIEKDSEFTLLPEGEYDFEVTAFERGRHNGSEKLPPCNKAVLTIRLSSPEGQTSTLQHNLFLHSSTEGMLCAFFVAIGQRKHGEKMNMNWNKVIGGRGRCKVGIRKWQGKDGQDMQSNQITRFLEPPEAPAQPAAAPAPSYQQGRF
jgi:hypothetical protein